MSLRYGSLCSGIEAATMAWHHMGWEPQWFSEIDKFPAAVLDHHWPSVPNLGDMTSIIDNEVFRDEKRAIDLLVGGTPCQSFSVAGLRKGLDDERGNLALEFVRILRESRPRWFVWENVPGVFSSNRGRDFACFLSALTERDIQPQKFSKGGIITGVPHGYTVAWRVLDAQYFGVAQRRKRVFVVGYSGEDWRPPAAVLFERESMSGNPPPSREKREGSSRDAIPDVAGSLDRECGGGKLTHQSCNSGHLIPEVIGTVTARMFNALGARDIEEGAVIVHGTQDPVVQNEKAFALGRNSGQENAVQVERGVRKLTPTECERLQGFPDGHTQIPWRGKSIDNCPDGPRYKAIGNSMAVPVMRWIGERINQVDQIIEGM